MPSRQQPNGSLLHGAQSVLFSHRELTCIRESIVGAIVVLISVCDGAPSVVLSAFFGFCVVVIVVVVVVVVTSIGQPS